ncbi:MAG: hypothetical protein ACI4PM_07350 [Butyricicoccus sp.]
MKKYWMILMGICGTLAGFGILTCILRAVCWEQTTVVLGGALGIAYWMEELWRGLPLYGGTIAMTVLTVWLMLQVWNAER